MLCRAGLAENAMMEAPKRGKQATFSERKLNDYSGKFRMVR
jgi:hypothetical protein